MKKVTAEEVFNAYQQTMASSPEKRFLFRQLPDRWKEVEESDQKFFQEMAWKMNRIVGEFEIEEQV